MSKSTDASRALIIMEAVHEAIRTSQPIFGKILTDEGGELAQLATAVARLKYLEFTLYKSWAAAKGSPEGLRKLTRDVLGTLVIVGGIGGWIEEEDVETVWGTAELKNTFKKVLDAKEKKDKGEDQDVDYAQIFKDFQENLKHAGISPY